LQELLRLGTPIALEEANELMKDLAGYVTFKSSFGYSVLTLHSKGTGKEDRLQKSRPQGVESDRDKSP
jgi:hypothetical protein